MYKTSKDGRAYLVPYAPYQGGKELLANAGLERDHKTRGRSTINGCSLGPIEMRSYMSELDGSSVDSLVFTDDKDLLWIWHDGAGFKQVRKETGARLDALEQENRLLREVLRVFGQELLHRCEGRPSASYDDLAQAMSLIGYQGEK